MEAEKKGRVEMGSSRKTSTLSGDDVNVSEGVNLKRARCLQRVRSVPHQGQSRRLVTHLGIFQFLLPFIKVVSWLTQIPVILESFLFFPSGSTDEKDPGSMASSSYVPTGLSLYLTICAKPRPPTYFPVSFSELNDSALSSRGS